MVNNEGHAKGLDNVCSADEQQITAFNGTKTTTDVRMYTLVQVSSVSSGKQGQKIGFIFPSCPTDHR